MDTLYFVQKRKRRSKVRLHNSQCPHLMEQLKQSSVLLPIHVPREAYQKGYRVAHCCAAPLERRLRNNRRSALITTALITCVVTLIHFNISVDAFVAWQMIIASLAIGAGLIALNCYSVENRHLRRILFRPKSRSVATHGKPTKRSPHREPDPDWELWDERMAAIDRQVKDEALMSDSILGCKSPLRSFHG